MFKKYELVGGAISVLCMAVALYLTQMQSGTALGTAASDTQLASVADNAATRMVVTSGEDDVIANRTNALRSSIDNNGTLKNMIIEDIKVGDGREVQKGDTVSVHYVGTLQNGTEFDNSKKKGHPFDFTVGEGQVIKGWDEGLVGMKVGGHRILVIPPDMAYGDRGIGPIPGGATLVFAIELVEVR